MRPGCQIVTQSEMKELLWKAKHKKKGRAIRSFCLSRHSHGSKSEAEYCNYLLAEKQGGRIRDYSCQSKITLRIRGRRWKDWAIDFKVIEKDGSESFHECKGWNFSDDNFRLKRDAFRICYPKARLFINHELYTGDPDRKKTTGFMRAVQRFRKAQEKRRHLQKSPPLHAASLSRSL